MYPNLDTTDFDTKNFAAQAPTINDIPPLVLSKMMLSQGIEGNIWSQGQTLTHVISHHTGAGVPEGENNNKSTVSTAFNDVHILEISHGSEFSLLPSYLPQQPPYPPRSLMHPAASKKQISFSPSQIRVAG